MLDLRGLGWWRDRRLYSVRDLSKRTRIAAADIERLERGERRAQRRTAQRLADVLGVTVEALTVPPESDFLGAATSAVDEGHDPVRRQYRNAPLVEAICDFRFLPGAPWDGSEPGRLYERLLDKFPKRQPVLEIEQSFTEQPEGISHRVAPVERLRLTSENGSGLVQVGINNLSIHHLPVYPGWPHFRPMIDNALEKYREVANPKGFQRIGLRYINRIRLPGGRIEPDDYFDFYPHVGPNLPEDYGLFVMGLHFLFDEHRDALRLQFSDTESDQPSTSDFILDLDYYLNQPEAVGFDAVAGWLEVAHNRVEEAFEGCIKPPLRELFDEVQE